MRDGEDIVSKINRLAGGEDRRDATGVILSDWPKVTWQDMRELLVYVDGLFHGVAGEVTCQENKCPHCDKTYPHLHQRRDCVELICAAIDEMTEAARSSYQDSHDNLVRLGGKMDALIDARHAISEIVRRCR